MISPADFLDEARDLAGDAATEARKRSAISRCYLACYHHVTRHPRAEEVVEKVRDHNSTKITAGTYTPGLNNLLIKGLVNSTRRDLIHIASTMHALLRAQAGADYALNQHFGERAVQESLRKAESVFADLPA